MLNTPPEVLFEDEYLLAINKPSGMVVNRGFASPGDTLQDWVESLSFWPASQRGERRPESTQVDTPFVQRSGVVHRLDKETSGVLLVAKTPEAFAELQRQFKDRETEKVYLGLVHGKVEPPKGEIDAPIGRNPRVRTKFAVLEGAREARTGYIVIANFSSREQERRLKSATTPEAYSLVEFHPKTGRTHQIRVHAKHIGHPIVSDYLYAGRKTTRHDRKWCPRLFLHAAKLAFAHPKTGNRLTIEAPLPQDLQSVLKGLA
ncbi:MAG: RluA family pseudouridine synthase [Candidatus Blackburnbacteria bacterium]|nr:RluA family pseudouridine synthase [Candidatus Blackburnbacteria bacterium]